MGSLQIAFKYLRRLKLEDILILLLLVFITLENHCDRNFKILLLIIFLSGLEQGVFGK